MEILHDGKPKANLKDFLNGKLESAGIMAARPVHPSRTYPVRQLDFSPFAKPSVTRHAPTTDESDVVPPEECGPGNPDPGGMTPSISSTSSAACSPVSTLQARTCSKGDQPQLPCSPHSTSSSIRSAQLANLLQELELEEEAGSSRSQPGEHSPAPPSSPAFSFFLAPSESSSSIGEASPPLHEVLSSEYHSTGSSGASQSTADAHRFVSCTAESSGDREPPPPGRYGLRSRETTPERRSSDEGDSPVLAWTTGRRQNTRRIIPDDDDEVRSASQGSSRLEAPRASTRAGMSPWNVSPPINLPPHPSSVPQERSLGTLQAATLDGMKNTRETLLPTCGPHAVAPEGRTPRQWQAEVPPPFPNEPPARDPPGGAAATTSTGQGPSWASLVNCVGLQNSPQRRCLGFPRLPENHVRAPLAGPCSPSSDSSLGSDLRLGRSSRKPRFCVLDDSEGSDADGPRTPRGIAAVSPQRAAAGTRLRRSPLLYAQTRGLHAEASSSSGGRGAGGRSFGSPRTGRMGATRSGGEGNTNVETARDGEGRAGGAEVSGAEWEEEGRDPYEFPEEGVEAGESSTGFDRQRPARRPSMRPAGAVLDVPGKSAGYRVQSLMFLVKVPGFLQTMRD